MRKLLSDFFNGLLVRSVAPEAAKSYVRAYLHDLRRAPVYQLEETPPPVPVNYSVYQFAAAPFYTLRTIGDANKKWRVRYRVDGECAVRVINVFADTKELAWSQVVERHAHGGQMVQTLILVEEVNE